MSEAEADAARWGLILPEGWDEDDEHAGGVWPENERAVHAFLEVCSQFRTVAHFDGTLQRTGLDYPAVHVGLKLAGVKVKRRLWSDIRIIEWGVITAHAEDGEA